MNKYFNHETAAIDKGAIIGKNTKIWHFFHISENAIIDENVIIGQNVFIGKNVKVGNRCKIQNNVSIYEGVYLEENVFIGPSVVFTNVNFPRANIEQKDKFITTIVKNGSTIGANSTIICGISLGRNSFIEAGSLVTKDVLDNTLVFG
jgi:UDP-2-acetamido-3-amino-2,3-dideoxy-glucuronate N-acetyltransferase